MMRAARRWPARRPGESAGGIRGIRLRAVALALLAAAAWWPQAVRAQNTPETLAEAFVESVRAEDRAGLRALVHPAVLESLPEARVRGAVDSWMDPEIPEDYQLRVKAPAEVEAYDPETRTYDLGGLPLRFPVAPDRFLEIVVTRRTPGQADGEGPQGAVTGPDVAPRGGAVRGPLVHPPARGTRRMTSET